MHIRSLWAPAAAGVSLFLITPPARAGYADHVVGYAPGTGFATEFGSGLGYTNSIAALGEPSRVTPGGQFGGPVDPFNPPFRRDQILSLGTGGSLVVRFDTAIENHPQHPFGLDFLVFGDTGFMIINGDYTGGGITDGSVFGGAEGPTRVSVSADGTTFFTLDPALAPIVDSANPTDGSGDFSRPVTPSLQPVDFDGKGLDGIRQLYGGSGGGVGFDLAWARDAGGNAVELSAISFIRIDVLGDRVEIDGFAGVAAVPEAEAWQLFVVGAGAWFLRKRSRANGRYPS